MTPLKGHFNCQDSFKNKSNLHAMIPYVNSKVLNVFIKINLLEERYFCLNEGNLSCSVSKTLKPEQGFKKE